MVTQLPLLSWMLKAITNEISSKQSFSFILRVCWGELSCKERTYEKLNSSRAAPFLHCCSMSSSTKACSPPSPSTSQQGRSSGRPSSEKIQQQREQSSPVSPSGRDGLHSFLHDELRISSEVADLYCNSLVRNGYDDVASLQDATEQDMKELGVKIGHIRRIKRAVFSNCMRSERQGASAKSSTTRKNSALSLFTDDITNENVVEDRKPFEDSLLSDYARQEMTNYTPPSRERNIDMELVSAKELLIRKQAEKIAALEAKLANTSMSSDPDELDELPSQHPGPRAGSADTQSKKLTAEERLELHRQRKLDENKYKEKTGVWEAPPPKANDTLLAKSVSENDDLVMKLSSDRTRRKKIEEVERKVQKAKVFQSDEGDPFGSRLQQSTKPSPGNKHRKPPNISSCCCATCGSTRDCEPDVDDPGIVYCKACWDQYDAVAERPPSTSTPQVARNQPTALKNNAPIVDVVVRHEALWIVHDNPQLGDRIVTSGPKKMECMLETKEPGKKNCVRILLGDIDFIGRVNDASLGKVIGREGREDNAVGTECIRIRNAKGYYVDHNLAAARLSKDKSVYEFHLGEENAHLLTGKSASKTVAEFFKDCNGAIDVILDPQKDVGGWYPQREAGDGGRRVAPQFRSKGVGYIRLGDDMSENGLAFLSSDACLTYLSSSSHMATPATNTGPPQTSQTSRKRGSNSEEVAVKVQTPATKSSSKKREDTTAEEDAPKAGKQSSFRQQHQPPPQLEDNVDADESSASGDDESSRDEGQNVQDVLKQLQSTEEGKMKWKDKAELLSQLGRRASKPDADSSRSTALMVIEDTLAGKNVNVHVLRSSLIAVGMIGVAMGDELVHQVSWKTIMIETLKLLKNKQVSSVAKTVLAQLHGHGFTLSNSMDCVAHVLGIGKAAAAPKARQSTANAGNANSIEVFEWLAEVVEREISMEVVEPMLDENGLSKLVNLFYSHVDHRDQQCRKSVMDGLVHCVLYGVQRLDMDLTKAMNMCPSSLKETNPRGWNQILSSVKLSLDK